MTKTEEIALLKSRNSELSSKVESLEQKVMQLLEIIEKQGIKKDSRNSSNPPSQDRGRRRNKSLRPKSTRKSGGQEGHKGTTLKMTETPDETKILRSNYCAKCGSDLTALAHELISKRQEVIIPPVVPQIVEYQQFGCLCGCGHHQKAAYPQGINAPIQFGGEIVALVSYFNVFQYVPYQRLKLLFEDVFNLSMSEGSIDNLLQRGARKAKPVYQAIFENIKQSKYIGSDETGAKVNGEKFWIWVWQNLKNTFLKASKSRGFETVAGVFPEGLPDAIIGSDRWAAQLKISSAAKQLCFPHLLRDLNYLIETEKTDWAQKFKDLLKEALDLKQISLAANKPFLYGEKQVSEVEDQLNKLLAFPIIKEHTPATLTFQTQMLKNRNHLFTFLYHLEVPPDNNASERAIRNVKVKQKISGQFKSGQDAFCILRSVIDTLRKRKLNVLENLKVIMNAPIPE